MDDKCKMQVTWDDFAGRAYTGYSQVTDVAMLESGDLVVQYLIDGKECKDLYARGHWARCEKMPC